MSGERPSRSRREHRHAQLLARRAERAQRGVGPAAGPGLGRIIGFAGIVAVVLIAGAVLAFGDFVDRPTGSSGQSTGVIDVQSSMAGFTPSEIHVTAGRTVTFRWWTDDAAPHLQGGVHTMISDELGLAESLSAEGDRWLVWTAPVKPGTYDIYCDTCCGGKASPTMHGTIVVDPATAATTTGEPA
jgi:plastocyanin